MKAIMFGNAQENKLLPEGRLSGPMPWVIAIIVLLTILAAATSMSLLRAAQDIGNEIAGRITIQIVEANYEIRNQQVRALETKLADLPNVKAVRPVSEAKIAASMEQWLGTQAGALDLPVPALIDVDLTGPADTKAISQLKRIIGPAIPNAKIEPHANWLGPVSALIRSLALIAGGLVLLLLLAATAIVMLSTRSALRIHNSTIELLHLIGASDAQISRLFQRRLALDAAFGSLAGFVGGLILILLVGGLVDDVGAALLADATLGWGWIAILLIPLLLVALASLTARWTIKRALLQIL